MNMRSVFKFIRSPDEAFPSYRSRRQSSASSFDSSALPLPFLLQESDARSSTSSKDSFYPFSFEKIFPPDASSVGSSSFSESVSLSFIDPDEVESQEPEQGLSDQKDGSMTNVASHAFTFRELATATKNFGQEFLLARGLFGDVYRCQMNKGQEFAVRKLNLSRIHENEEFNNEIFLLSFLHHPNIINLIGHCVEGDQRLLVYRYMPLGSLKSHLFDLPPDRKPLDWNSRMKIAAGVAKGLEYLHDKAHQPVIQRNLSSSTILLDEGYRPKLSNFLLAKQFPVKDKVYFPIVKGVIRYMAPECFGTGQLTPKVDVYSFGIVFLELITGRRVTDIGRELIDKYGLVPWPGILLKNPRNFGEMVDPLLRGQYSMRRLCRVLEVAAMCLQEQPEARPSIGDVVTVLTDLAF